MPKLFDSPEEFTNLFQSTTSSKEEQTQIVKQIHRLLRPFMLRRIKKEVEQSLPDKKEIYIYIGMVKHQKMLYKNILLKNVDVVNGAGEKQQMLNVLMQL